MKTMSKTQNQSKLHAEICNECRRSVGFKNGLFINRVVDLDNYQTRKEMNKPFPQGGYICRE